MRPDGGIRPVEDHTCLRELIVCHDETARIDELGPGGAVQIGCQDEGGHAFAEAPRDIERPRGAIAEQIDSVEKIPEFAEPSVQDLRGSPVDAAAPQLLQRVAVTVLDLPENTPVSRVSGGGEARRFQQLVRDSLKRGTDYGDALFLRSRKDDARDIAHPLGGRKGGASELKNLHRISPSSRSSGSRTRRASGRQFRGGCLFRTSPP